MPFQYVPDVIENAARRAADLYQGLELLSVEYKGAWSAFFFYLRFEETPLEFHLAYDFHLSCDEDQVMDKLSEQIAALLSDVPEQPKVAKPPAPRKQAATKTGKTVASRRKPRKSKPRKVKAEVKTPAKPPVEVTPETVSEDKTDE